MNSRPYGIEEVERVLSDDRYRRTFGIPEWVDAIGLEFVRDESARMPFWVPWMHAPFAAFTRLRLEHPEWLCGGRP